MLINMYIGIKFLAEEKIRMFIVKVECTNLQNDYL